MKVIVTGYDYSSTTPGTKFIAKLFDERLPAVQYAETLAAMGPRSRERHLPAIRTFIEGGSNHVDIACVDVAIVENA